MKTQSTSPLRRLLVPGMCAVFFLLAVSLALMSAGTYTNAVETSGENSMHRISLSYIANKVRGGDCADTIAIGTFGETDALAIYEGEYVTFIYCEGGYLRELFTDIESGLQPSDGMEIAELESLEISYADGGILLNSAGNTMFLSPRCGVEEGVEF